MIIKPGQIYHGSEDGNYLFVDSIAYEAVCYNWFNIHRSSIGILPKKYFEDMLKVLDLEVVDEI